MKKILNVGLVYGPSHSMLGKVLKDKGSCVMSEAASSQQSTIISKRQDK